MCEPHEVGTKDGYVFHYYTGGDRTLCGINITTHLFIPAWQCKDRGICTQCAQIYQIFLKEEEQREEI